LWENSSDELSLPNDLRATVEEWLEEAKEPDLRILWQSKALRHLVQ
jgi:hypothetical protein